MDIREQLKQLAEGDIKRAWSGEELVKLCRDALAEIERLERGTKPNEVRAYVAAKLLSTYLLSPSLGMMFEEKLDVAVKTADLLLEKLHSTAG